MARCAHAAIQMVPAGAPSGFLCLHSLMRFLAGWWRRAQHRRMRASRGTSPPACLPPSFFRRRLYWRAATLYHRFSCQHYALLPYLLPTCFAAILNYAWTFVGSPRRFEPTDTQTTPRYLPKAVLLPLAPHPTRMPHLARVPPTFPPELRDGGSAASRWREQRSPPSFCRAGHDIMPRVDERCASRFRHATLTFNLLYATRSGAVSPAACNL